MEYNWSITERDPYLVGSLGSLCRFKRFFYPTLAALIGPVQNICSSSHTFSLYVSIAQQPEQAVVPGHRLSLNMCLWIYALFWALSEPFFTLGFGTFPLFSKHITEKLVSL
jgi:hypothetical protein